jgi:hypothetical protein
LPPARRARRARRHPRRCADQGLRAGLADFNLSLVVARRIPLVDEEAQAVLGMAVFIRRSRFAHAAQRVQRVVLHRRGPAFASSTRDVLPPPTLAGAELAAVRRQLAAAGVDRGRIGGLEHRK